MYDNLNKRQVSHFPFIELVDNARVMINKLSLLRVILASKAPKAKLAIFGGRRANLCHTSVRQQLLKR